MHRWSGQIPPARTARHNLSAAASRKKRQSRSAAFLKNLELDHSVARLQAAGERRHTKHLAQVAKAGIDSPHQGDIVKVRVGAVCAPGSAKPWE